MIFSKSSEVVSELELACCRRVVQLCRDCLLIVYQFASEAQAAVAPPLGSPAGDAVNKYAPSCLYQSNTVAPSVAILCRKRQQGRPPAGAHVTFVCGRFALEAP